MTPHIHVLIVDDEKRFVENTAKILRRRGYEVSSAFDGLQAVEAFQRGTRFDVVVLDVRMPGMDGIETLKEIKRIDSQVEVIMLTGHASLESGTRAMRLGAFDYLMKPCDLEDLTAKINEALEVEKIRRQPVLWPRNRVKDLALYSFIRLETRDPLAKALAVFKRENRRAQVETVFIQDDQGRFKGIVSRQDLLDEARQAHPETFITWSELIDAPDLLPPKPLEQIMSKAPPQAAAPEDPLTDTAHRMIRHNIRCLPVLKGENVIGIVRLQDILRYVEHETE